MVSGLITGSMAVPSYRTGSCISEYLERVDDYILATIGDECSPARKLAILKTVIGEEANGTIKNFTADEKSSYDNLTKKLVSYYKPTVSTSTYRHQFYNM